MTMLNRSVIDEVRVDRVVHTAGTDDEQPILAIRYNIGQKTSLTSPSTADSDNYHRVIIDANGSGDSRFILFLDIGPSATDYQQYQFSAKSTGVTDPGVGAGAVDSSPTHTQCATLLDMVEALNAIPGVDAYCNHALTSLSLDSANFIDVAVANGNIPSHNFIKIGLRDFSAAFATSMRIGVPEVRDSGRMKLLRITGTSTGNTNGTVKLYRDAEGDASPVELLSFAQATAQTEYVNYNMDEAPVYRGPLVLVVASDDLSACDIKVHTVQAEW